MRLDVLGVQRSSVMQNKATEEHIVGYVTLGKKCRKIFYMPDFLCLLGLEAFQIPDR